MPNDPIRVLQVVNVASVTTKGFFLPMARRLQELGYDVTFALAAGEYLDGFTRRGCKVVTVPIQRRIISPWHPVAIWKLYTLMRRERFHIVHTHTPIASALARVAAAMAGVPIVIYHMRGSYFDEGPLVRGVFLSVEKLLSRFTTFIFTINQADADDLVRHRIVSPDRVLCLGCGGAGVDLRIFDPTKYSEAALDRLRSQLGIQQNARILGFVGRMVAVKGILDLLEAFRIIAARYDDVVLLMVGGVLESERDHRALPEFKRRAAQYGLEQRIVFTGFRENVADLLALMDILVLPSHAEWFGMTIAEAAAMGKPAVVTATRGGRQAVVHGETGLIVPIGAPAELAEAICMLLEHPERALEMGQKARQRAEEVFAEDRVLDLELSVYQRLIAERLPIKSHATVGRGGG